MAKDRDDRDHIPMNVNNAMNLTLKTAQRAGHNLTVQLVTVETYPADPPDGATILYEHVDTFYGGDQTAAHTYPRLKVLVYSEP
ncbi:MAG: hypothetical protein ABI282_01395 [Candidatus Baltobacteraceae bacterium]